MRIRSELIADLRLSRRVVIGEFTVESFLDESSRPYRYLIEVTEPVEARCCIHHWAPRTTDLRRGVECESDGERVVLVRNGPKCSEEERIVAATGPDLSWHIRVDAIYDMLSGTPLLRISGTEVEITDGVSARELALLLAILCAGVPETMILWRQFVRSI